VRRSLPIILGLIVLGIVAVNVFKAIQGPQYEANARVLIATTPLSSIITGTEPSFVDPQRIQQTALGIADSPRVYDLAARETQNQFGDSDDLDASTEATGDPESDLITFTSQDADSDNAIGAVNAVARAYIDFRADLTSSQITSTIDLLRSRIEELPAGSSERAGLQAQLTNLELVEDAPGETELVEPASSADKISPAPIRDSLIGFSIGLIVALLAVALREAIDTTIRSETDVEDLLSVPVLASVRTLPRRTRMVTYGRHEAAFADAYALIAAQIEANGRSSPDASVIAITSAAADEGKTTTAANLAVAVARRGRRVVLCDFDFRKATLANLFGVSPSAAGALQVMSGGTELGDVLWSISLDGPAPRASLNGAPAPPIVRTGGIAGEQAFGTLELLPSGGVIPTSKVPQRARLAAVLQQLRDGADLVILDTPPALLTVEVAELAQLIDSVVVVVRQGHVSERNLRMLARQSRTWPAELAGAVMTDVRTEGEYSHYGGR
jgi:Mrp family chromosome partitioning ATPase/capsular polysaccharide biosynthesis protein